MKKKVSDRSNPAWADSTQGRKTKKKKHPVLRYGWDWIWVTVKKLAAGLMEID